MMSYTQPNIIQGILIELSWPICITYSSKGDTPTTIKIMFPWQLTLFQSPPTLFQSFGDFQHKKTLNSATNSS